MARPTKEVSDQNFEKFQKEIESAGNNVDLLMNDKMGRSWACLLCRRRKQKCDQKLPNCTVCLKAAVKCVQPRGYSHRRSKLSPTSEKSDLKNDSAILSDLNENYAGVIKISDEKSESNDNKDNYTLFLEKKLKYLEQLIALPAKSKKFTKKVKGYKNISHLLGNVEDLEKIIDRLNSDETILKNEDTRLKSQTISKSDFPLPNKKIVYSRPNDSLSKFNTSNEIIDVTKCIFYKYNISELHEKPATYELAEEQSRSFLDVFFSRLQFKYPLLNETEIYKFYDDFVMGNTSQMSKLQYHFLCGRMWLVFTISACLHMTTGKYKGHPPTTFFTTATHHISICSNELNYFQQMELLTLLVLYLIRTDRDTLLLYEIISDVMHIVKDKLHLHIWNPQDPLSKMKLRQFWCIYLLERMICVAVGKPYRIDEKEINLPLFDEDSFNTCITPENPIQKTKVHFINQSLRLRRLESRFVEDLAIVPQCNNKSKHLLQAQLPLVKRYFQDLELWRSNCSMVDVRNFENETLKLYYFRSVRLLLQPFLELLTPEDRLFRECQAAAGQICQLYKNFHQKTMHGNSTPAVHTVFVAGVTLIYCMWLARNLDDEKRRELGDDSKHTRPLVSASLFSTLDDLRACSVSLYVMAERSNFARIFRNTFDQLMNATIGNLIERCGPDSSELIYITGGNSNVLLANDENGETKRIENADETTVIEVAKDRKQFFEKNRSLPPVPAKEPVAGVNASAPLPMLTPRETPGSATPRPDTAATKSPGAARHTTAACGVTNTRSVANPHNATTARNVTTARGVTKPTARDVAAAAATSLAVDGMQPAINRRFGRHPIDNTIGFVDGVTVDDLEEQIEDEKKQHALEEKTIPKKLSILLDSPVTFSIPTSNRYIVKKPVNCTEIDWKNIFEHKAFYQQKIAQESLQLYLKSVNKPHLAAAAGSPQDSAPFTAQHPLTAAQIATATAGSPAATAAAVAAGDPDVSDGLARTRSGSVPGLGSAAATPPLPKMSLPLVAGREIFNDPLPDENSPYAPSTAASTTATAITTAPQPPLNLVPTISNTSNPADIFFNNGTHDMINNISTWTNNAIADVPNGPSPVDLGFLNLPADLLDTTLPHPDDSPHHTIAAASATTTTADPFAADAPFHPPTTANPAATLWNVSNSSLPEQFWVVNDDYGFLT